MTHRLVGQQASATSFPFFCNYMTALIKVVKTFQPSTVCCSYVSHNLTRCQPKETGGFSLWWPIVEVLLLTWNIVSPYCGTLQKQLFQSHHQLYSHHIFQFCKMKAKCDKVQTCFPLDGVKGRATSLGKSHPVSPHVKTAKRLVVDICMTSAPSNHNAALPPANKGVM